MHIKIKNWISKPQNETKMNTLTLKIKLISENFSSVVMQILIILGCVTDKATCISLSAIYKFSLIFMLVKAENPDSHK